MNVPTSPPLEREGDLDARAWMRHGHPQRQRAGGEAEQEKSYGDEPRERALVTT